MRVRIKRLHKQIKNIQIHCLICCLSFIIYKKKWSEVISSISDKFDNISIVCAAKLDLYDSFCIMWDGPMIVSNYRRMYVTVDTADGTAYLSALYRSDWIYNLLGKLHHFRIWWSHRTSSNGFILYDHFQGGEMQLLIPSQLGETERVTWDSSGASCRVYSLKIHGYPATMNIVSQDTYRWGLIRC